jgi:hypothetical protein
MGPQPIRSNLLRSPHHDVAGVAANFLGKEALHAT